MNDFVAHGVARDDMRGATESFVKYSYLVKNADDIPRIMKEAFHIALLHGVEDEFEHNMAQQLYVSPDVWEVVKRAKEELVGQINTTFDKSEADTEVTLIAQALVALPNPFVDQAVLALKKEFNEI